MDGKSSPGFLFDSELLVGLIKPCPGILKLKTQLFDVFLPVNVGHDKKKISRPGNRQNLLTSSLTQSCSLNKSRNVQDLNIGTPIKQHSRNYGNGCKCIRSNLGFGIGNLIQKCGLTRRRRPD